MASCSNVTNRDTSYCCDKDAGCCDSGTSRFELLPSSPTVTATWNAPSYRFVVIDAPSSSTASHTLEFSTILVTPSTSPPQSTGISPEPSASTSALPVGAKAGIGVGVFLMASILGVLTYILWRVRKSKVSYSQHGQAQESSMPGMGTSSSGIPGSLDGKIELPGHHSNPQEMPSMRSPRELPAETYARR